MVGAYGPKSAPKSTFAQNPDYEPVWLKNGDIIEMEIEGLGKIKNKVVLETNILVLDKKLKANFLN